MGSDRHICGCERRITNANAYCYSDCHSHSHSYCDGHSDSNSYANGYGDSHSHSQCDTDS